MDRASPKSEQQAAQEDQQVLALQMDALYKAVPAAILSIFAAFMTLYTFWSPATAFGLSLWMAWMIAIASLHVSAAYARGRQLLPSWSDAAWSKMACFIYLNAGLSWGVGGAWLIGHGTDPQIFVMTCIVMGAVMVTFPIVVYPPAYNLFQAGAMLTFAVGLAVTPMEYGWVLAIGFVLMAIFGSLIGYGMGNQVIAGMRLSIENKQLAMRLEERGLALEAANRELEIQSQTDPLTGVANRRWLMAFARAAAEDCALLVVDVDNFKAYNDSYGHVEGDACLVAVAECLSDAIDKDRHLVARLGGEEFAVVLSDIAEEEALTTAETMRVGIERLFGSTHNAVRRPITVSIGLAYRNAAKYKTLAELMDEADVAVYRSKAGGRNLVSTGAQAIKQGTA